MDISWNLLRFSSALQGQILEVRMARLETVKFQPHRACLDSDRVIWTDLPLKGSRKQAELRFPVDGLDRK
jgi:hypothetical protein